MAKSGLALKDFLARHCRIHPSPANVNEEEYYLLATADCKVFMAESHLREILRAVRQYGESPAALRNGDEVANAIVVDRQHLPDTGIEHIRIPLKLVDSLHELQAFLILRNLEGIQKDVDEGRLYKDRLEALFQDTANIRITNGDDGERRFEITGKLSATDKRRYMERYAEHVASRTLFDVARALNGRLAQYTPPELQGKYFVEGRDFSDKKIRYGEEVGTELELTDEGAWAYTNLVNKNPHLRETITKLFQQAILDPFGLSMAHYMGKHNVLKAGKRPLVKIPPVGSFISWLKGLFKRKAD